MMASTVFFFAHKQKKPHEAGVKIAADDIHVLKNLHVFSKIELHIF